MCVCPLVATAAASRLLRPFDRGAIGTLAERRNIKWVRFSRWLPQWIPVTHKGHGSKPMVPFWDRCTTHFSLFSGDWDVHWGFDPWPYLASNQPCCFWCVKGWFPWLPAIQVSGSTGSLPHTHTRLLFPFNVWRNQPLGLSFYLLRLRNAHSSGW